MEIAHNHLSFLFLIHEAFYKSEKISEEHDDGIRFLEIM